MESLATDLFLDIGVAWSLEQHRKLHDAYFAQRNEKAGFRAPHLFEAGFSLALAERYRLAERADEALELIHFAADNTPRFTVLGEMASAFDPNVPINWNRLHFNPAS